MTKRFPDKKIIYSDSETNADMIIAIFVSYYFKSSSYNENDKNMIFEYERESGPVIQIKAGFYNRANKEITGSYTLAYMGLLDQSYDKGFEFLDMLLKKELNTFQN